VVNLYATDRAGVDFASKDELAAALSAGTAVYFYRVGPHGLADRVALTDVGPRDVIIGPTYYARPRWTARIAGGEVV
jgi:hypothetical protein